MEKKSLIRRLFDSTLIRFGLVGVANTLFGSAIMFVLYNVFGASYWLSSACNYVFGSILSYFLNKYFTFRDHTRSWKQVLRFTVNIVCCYLLAYGIAKPLVYHLLSGAGTVIQDNVAMLAGMVLYVGFNYVGQRFFAFRKEKSDREEN